MIRGRGVTAMASAGGGKGIYTVELPRSKYYEDVAEWVVTSGPNTPGKAEPSLQVVCNGELWCVDQSGIYSMSLATKEVTYSESATFYLQGWVGYSMCGIATDGESRIWVTSWSHNVSASNSLSGTVYLYLTEYNTLTHTKNTFAIITYSGGTSSSRYLNCGTLMYSSKYNRIYVLGAGCASNSSTYVNRLNVIVDLSDYSVSTPIPIMDWGASSHCYLNNCYWYEDEEGYIYFGNGAYINTVAAINSGNVLYNTYIFRLNPADNSITVVKTDFDDQYRSNQPIVGYFTIGDTLYIMSQTMVVAIDPTTGAFREGVMPAVLGDPLNPGKQAIYNNTIYIWQNVQDRRIVECHFFTESPPKAPIVAKIYKGQKFHTLVPFKLLRQNIEVTTVQQTATEDIEIKMYDYSSEGGQILYIETA